jgi:hypothetical protein
MKKMASQMLKVEKEWLLSQIGEYHPYGRTSN